MSQVSDGKVKMTPRARLLLGCVLYVGLIRQKLVPLVGRPALPFIDQGEQGLHMGEREKNQR